MPRWWRCWSLSHSTRSAPRWSGASCSTCRTEQDRVLGPDALSDPPPVRTAAASAPRTPRLGGEPPGQSVCELQGLHTDLGNGGRLPQVATAEPAESPQPILKGSEHGSIPTGGEAEAVRTGQRLPRTEE